MEEEVLTDNTLSSRFHRITAPIEPGVTVTRIGNHSSGTFVKCVADPIHFFGKWITWKKIDVDTAKITQCVHSTTFLFLALEHQRYTVLGEVHQKQFPNVLDKPLERFFIKIMPVEHENDISSDYKPSKPYVWRNDSDSFLKKYTLPTVPTVPMVPTYQKRVILPHLIAGLDDKGKEDMF